MSPEVFAARVNEAIEEGGLSLVDGYAPFCKHVFVPAFFECRVGVVKITDALQPLIK